MQAIGVHFVLSPSTGPTTTAAILKGERTVLAVGAAFPGERVVAATWGSHAPLVARLVEETRRGTPVAVYNGGIDAALLATLSIDTSSVYDVAGLHRAVGLGDSLFDVVAGVGHGQSLADAESVNPVRVAAIGAMCILKACLRFVRLIARRDESWAITSTIRLNTVGLRVDVVHARRLQQDLMARRDGALRALATRHPTFDTGRCRDPAAVREHCRREWGVEIDRFDRGTIARLKTAGSNGVMIDFLENRRVVDVAGAMADRVHQIADGPSRIYSYLRYCGAHTGRFSSGGEVAGRFNVHGLAKGSADVPELRELRELLVPDEGESWVAADLAAIEPRVLGFLAGEKDLLARFAAGDDVYLWFGSQAFPGVEIERTGPSAYLRTAAKQAVLGLGYGMGAETFHERLTDVGLDLDRSTTKALREKYNEVFPNIVGLRKDLWRAFLDVERGAAERVVRQHLRVRARRTPGRPDLRTVVVELPTERALYYHAIRRTEHGARDGRRYASLWAAQPLSAATAPVVQTEPASEEAEYRTFSDGITRRRLSAPVLVENVVQAVARDLLVAMCAEAEREGLRVVLHVHDEIIAAVPACACTTSHDGCSWRRGQAVLAGVMSTVPSSLPRLEGLPVACEINHRVRSSYAP